MHEHATPFPPFPLEDARHHMAAMTSEVMRVMMRGGYVLGDEVRAFENEFAQWLGLGHAVGVASGTDAIELMLRALDIGSGSSVVLPAFAPGPVAAAVLRAGAGIVYADIEPETFTLCARSLKAVLNSPAGRSVKAVLAVHLFGHTADWDALQRVADAHGVALLEDCAQAHGARSHGRMAGTLGRMAAFSFYPTKNLAALGDAGAVVTQDAALAERLRSLRQYGWRERQVSDEAGVNSRLDELQAAVLRVKLRTLDEALLKRRALAARYDERLGAAAPVVRAGCDHARHLLVIRSAERDALLARLMAKGVPVAVHYPVALHQQRAFACAVSLPESERAAREVLTLPLHPYLSPEAVTLVCDAIARV